MITWEISIKPVNNKRESTVRKFQIVQQEDSRTVSREVEHYNLDAINNSHSLEDAQRGTAILCTEKNQPPQPLCKEGDCFPFDKARWWCALLPEGNNQIFASRHKLYLPTEEELAVELHRQRQALELERRLAQEIL